MIPQGIQTRNIFDVSYQTFWSSNIKQSKKETNYQPQTTTSKEVEKETFNNDKKKLRIIKKIDQKNLIKNRPKHSIYSTKKQQSTYSKK